MIFHPIRLMSSPAIRREPAARVALRALLASSLALAFSACGAAPASIGDAEQPFTAGNEDEDDASAEEGSSAGACASGADVETAASGDCPFVARGRLCFSTSEAACACAGCSLSECAIAESFPAQAFCPANGGGSDPDGSTSDDPNTPVSSHPQGGGSNGSSGDPLTGSTGNPGGGISGSPGNAGDGSAPTSPGGGSNGSPGCADPGAPACNGGVPRDPTGSCDFLVGETCFDSAASACACAGCAEDRCLILESHPAQISCE
jgi:hypothetical protein